MSVLLGKRLKALRKLKLYTQEDLATRVGMSVSVLSKIERGGKYPKPEQVAKMASTLGVSINELFVLPESMSKHSLS